MGPTLPFLYAFDQLTCTPANGVSSTVLPRRGKGSVFPSVAVSEGQDQLYNPIFTVLSDNEAMYINTDCGCNRAMDPDITIDSSSGLDDTWHQVAEHVT